MSFDISMALQLASDIASDAKNPAAVIGDALTLYRVYGAMPASSKVGAIVVALDKDGLLGSAIDALADLAPVLQTVIKNPAQKARLLAVMASL